MRQNKFILSILLVFLFLNESAGAQDAQMLLAGNVILGFPSGDFKQGYSYATGFDATMGFGGKKLLLTGTTGYVTYKQKDANTYGKITLIPFKAGLRIYPYKDFFLSANAGMGFLKDANMLSRETRFIYDLGFGIHSGVIQVGLSYDGWKRKNTTGTSNTLQLKMGIALKG
jgi:hypothetical protein